MPLHAPYTPEADAIREAFEPAMRGDLKNDAPAVLDGRLTKEQGRVINDIAYRLQLSAGDARVLAEEIANRLNPETGALPLSVNESNVAELFDEYAESFPSREEAEETYARARTYLENTLDARELCALDRGIGSTAVAFSPTIVRKLATLYSVRFGGGGQ